MSKIQVNKCCDVYSKENTVRRHGSVVSAFAFQDGILAFADSRETTTFPDKSQTIRDDIEKHFKITDSIHAIVAGDSGFADWLVVSAKFQMKKNEEKTGNPSSLMDLSNFLNDLVDVHARADLAGSTHYDEKDGVDVLCVGGPPGEELSAFLLSIELFPLSLKTNWMRTREERRKNIHSEKPNYFFAGSGAFFAEHLFEKVFEEEFGGMCNKSLSYALDAFFALSNYTCLSDNGVGGPMWTIVFRYDDEEKKTEVFSPFRVQFEDEDTMDDVIVLRQRFPETAPKPTEDILETLRKRGDVYAVTRFCRAPGGSTIYYRILTHPGNNVFNDIVEAFGEKGKDGPFVLIGQLPEYADTAVTRCTHEFMEWMETFKWE